MFKVRIFCLSKETRDLSSVGVHEHGDLFKKMGGGSVISFVCNKLFIKLIIFPPYIVLYL